MKKSNAIIIATIFTTFIVSMFAFLPTKTEASNNVLPSATPSPRKIGKKTNANGRNQKAAKPSADGTTQHFYTRGKTKRKSNTGDGTTNHFRTKVKRPNKPKGFTEVTGLDIQVERRKNPRRKSSQ